MASERSRMVNGLNGNYLDEMGIIRDYLIQSLFIGCKEARRDFIWLFWHFLPQWRSKNNLKFIDQNGFVLYLTFWARWGWQIFVSQNFWIFRKAKPKIGMGLGLCEELVGFKSCTILFPFFHSVHCAFTKYASKWSHLLGWWVSVDTWQSRRARDASCCHWLALVALSSYWPILSRFD